ncbi:MAG: enoyl-CoA hydratase-related protein [Myxococcales bacterium]|nr:enoyl-CoA hydratase-related protein [Myxococcales bacterium]
MDYQQIRYDISDRVLTLTLHRPDRLNAFTPRMFAELMGAFNRADADDGVRAVVVTGAGRAFCAGADLEAGADTWSGGGEVHTAYQDQPEGDLDGQLTRRIFDSHKPVIAGSFSKSRGRGRISPRVGRAFAERSARTVAAETMRVEGSSGETPAALAAVA